MKKKILIVGGTGFIGYHLAKACLKLNWNVTSLSIKKPSKLRKLIKVKYFYCNIGKANQIKKLSKLNFNYVVNLGGYIDHFNKENTYKSHFIGVKNLANLFLKKNIESFIQIGSSAEYGNIKSPHLENAKCNPKLIYGKSKLKATNYLLKLYKKKKFPVTILRLYQIYGGKQNFDRFLPILIKACIKNREFNASHGKQKRDFMHVNDAVEAILKCFASKKSTGKIINLGSGKPMTLVNIMRKVQRIIGGGKILLGKIKLRVDEPMIIYPNLKNAKNLLSWKHKVIFQEGIKKTIKEYEKELS